MRILLALLATLSFAASASAECFAKRSANRYQVQGDSLIIMAGGSQYRADVGVCPDLRWARQIGFESFSSAWVCDGDYVITYDSSGRATDRCYIWRLERY